MFLNTIYIAGYFRGNTFLRFSRIDLDLKNLRNHCLLPVLKDLSTVGVWPFERLSSKIKSAKCLVLSNLRKFSASKITHYTVLYSVVTGLVNFACTVRAHKLNVQYIYTCIYMYTTSISWDYEHT